jgi:RNA polymerase sigma-70 factor (ECF subfamily)
MSEAIGALGRTLGVRGPTDEAGPGSVRPDESRPGVGMAGVSVGQASDAAVHVARLYRELFPAVFGFIRFRVGNVQLAEDLTALVFERALTKLSSVRETDRVRGWLFTIARNAVADERRRRKPTAELEVAEALDHLWIESPESQALQRDEWRRLMTYLSDLDDRERELIGLRFVAGLSHREIGELLDLTDANVAQIVHRAVVKLRRRFTSEEHP